MNEYHKIETPYERDRETHKLREPLKIKNRVYEIPGTWHFTEKIDGTNIRVLWDGHSVTFGGRTDRAQLPAPLVNWLNERITDESFRAAFPDLGPPSTVTLYGEGYGAGIQKGGGDYSPQQQFILFDVAVAGERRYWLSDADMRDVAATMGLDAVPSFGELSLEEATKVVRAGFPSRLNEGKRRSEGLVGRPVVPLFDGRGQRLIVKLKTSDFGDGCRQ